MAELDTLCECGGTGEVPATPGQPSDGTMPCQKCLLSLFQAGALFEQDLEENLKSPEFEARFIAHSSLCAVYATGHQLPCSCGVTAE